MEWVLTLPIIVVMIAVLYQALMFERDVFNKMNIARYQAFKEAHERQNVDGMAEYEIFQVEVQGEKVGDLTSFSIPAQTVDPERRYGPRTYHFPCGTKRYFPGGSIAETALDVAEVAMVVADHYEDTAEYVDDVTDALGEVGNAADAIPCEQAQEFFNGMGDVADVAGMIEDYVTDVENLIGMFF